MTGMISINNLQLMLLGDETLKGLNLKDASKFRQKLSLWRRRQDWKKRELTCMKICKSNYGCLKKNCYLPSLKKNLQGMH